jgi:hypothetical protein
MPEVRCPVMPASNTKRREQIPEVQFPVMPASDTKRRDQIPEVRCLVMPAPNINVKRPNARGVVTCDACS